jgi:hypothetical protein
VDEHEARVGHFFSGWVFFFVFFIAVLYLSFRRRWGGWQVRVRSWGGTKLWLVL